MLDDILWMARCARVGSQSPDPTTKVGCVILGPDQGVRSEACNTYPNRVLGDVQERTEAPLKYLWIEHAERNAIYLAARSGISTEGCTIFVELTPCMECARAIIQAGIDHVVINGDRSAVYCSNRYTAEHSTALAMLAEAGIAVRFVSPSLYQQEREETSSVARVQEILSEAKRLAVEYYRLTGKPLGVTGEVAEYVAAEILGLKLSPPRTTGYDALRGSERIQIKGRAHGKKTNSGQKIGRIKADSPCDSVLLVVLDSATLDPREMWEAPFASVVEQLAQPGSRARERGVLSIPEFTRIARLVWPPGEARKG